MTAPSTTILALSDLEALVAHALGAARAAGASQAEVGVSVSTGLSVTVRLGNVETLEYQRDRGVGLTVYMGKRKGSVSSGDLSAQAIDEAVRKAVSIASFTAADEYSGLADPDSIARDIPDLDLSHPWDIDAERAVEIATQCEAAALAVDKRITNSEGASISTHFAVRAYGNSHGFVSGYPSTNHSLSCVVLGSVGEDMQRDYWYTTARDASTLEAAESVGRRAAQRTIKRLGARKIATTRAPVLFGADLARGLIGSFVGAIRGSAQYRRSSFLLDSVGQQIFPEFFAISERPHIKRALGSSPFDGEGVATRDRELIEKGVLTGYVLSSYSARKLGLKTTGNAGGVHNLIVKPSGDDDLEALLRRMGRGLYVTEMMGQGVNPVTGDYSRGAAGYWVEGGKLQYPVHEITIAGNLKDMLRNIVAVGADVDPRGSILTGSILVEEMTIAGD